MMYQSSTATPVFVEEHDLITPPDGVVNLSVGGGTVVNGTFSDIDWSQSVFMKEELDTGSGYQDMGTKQLTTVPYAEYSSGVQGVNLTGENVAVGNNAMKNKDFTSSAGNIAIGEYALQTRTTEISNGSINVAIGYNALKDNRSGDDNVAINKGALEKNNDGNNNIAIGTNSINKNINGGSNIAIGQYSLESSIAASQSIAIGYQAMQYFNNGGEVVNSSNTAIGVYALRGESSTSSNTGRGNTAVGYSSLGNNTTGTGNTAFGKNSLLFNNEGGLNTAIGNGSMYNNTQGIRNTSLGYQSLFNNTQGNYNVTVGYGSGFDNTVGDRLTLIGYNSDTDGESNLTNATAIGADATVTLSNTIQLGSVSVTLVNTSGVVSASGFKGNGDEITLTDSGTIITLLDKIAQLENKIEQLETNQSTTSNTSTNSTSGIGSITFSSFTPTQEADSVSLFAVFSDPSELYDSMDSSGGFYVEIWDDPSQKTVHELSSISGYQLTAEIDNLESSTKYYYRFGYETYSVQAESITQSFNTKSVLGDEAYGGTIVELESNGLHGRVVAPSTFWILKKWSDLKCEADGLRPTRQDGHGYEATQEIIEYFENVDASAPAAEYCWSLDIYGYDDWYLPLAEEGYDALNEMERLNRLSIEQENARFWTTRNVDTQDSCQAYYATWNGNQNIFYSNRDYEYYVMPMRNF